MTPSDTGETTEKGPLGFERQAGLLIASSSDQTVHQKPDQKLIITNPRVRRYHSTEAFRNAMEEKAKDDTHTAEINEIKRKRRSLPFRPFLWRKREKSENEPLERPNKRSASKCKPLQRFVNKKRISLPPVLKMNFGPDKADGGDKVVKANPQFPQSAVHLLNKEQTSTDGQYSRYVHIQRQDENMPFGIFVKKGTHGFVVTRVPETCPLRLGDEIVEINGSQCPDMSLSWLVCHLQSCTSIHARVLSAKTTNDQIQ
ncbi:unnamed protein product [Dibothriocephalus latus]|uniref:PDZ domain-containing protein n=1 Tax=Dibothriocephalus latus TaxID=60516 RepID=A0A3P7LQT4_DIBLA|nr:unnamed protein product [Dibothriocephalus latus]